MNETRLHNLIDGLLDERLAESDQAELAEILRASAAARSVYWELVEQDCLLHDVVRESAGRDLARLAANDFWIDEFPVATSSSSSSSSSSSANQRRSARGRRLWFTASAILLAVVAGIALGGRSFWSGRSPIAPATSREAVASLRSMAGDVRCLDAESRSVNVSSGQPFYTGDAVRVGEESAAEVVLADGSRLVLGANTVLQFPAADIAGERRVHLERGSADVEAARQSPNDPLILSTGQARLMVLGTRFRLYAGTGDSRVELEEGKVQFKRQSDGEAVEVVAGQYAIAVASDEPALPLIAQPLGDDWRLWQTLLRAGRQVTFSHSGSRLATASHSHIQVWAAATGELAHTLKSSAWSDSLAFTASDEALIALSESGQSQVWKIGTPSAAQTELKCDQGVLRRCAVSRNGRWLAQTSSVESGYLPVWTVDESGTISLVRVIPMKAGSVALAETEDGPVVVASQWNGTTVKWDAANGEELARFRFRSELFRTALSLDGRLLAGFGNAEGLLLIDTESGQSRNLWPPGSVRVNCLRFTADGMSVFAAMNDGVARAWSTVDGRPLLVLSTGDSQVTALDVSADGKWLATAGDDGNVKVWQRESQ